MKPLMAGIDQLVGTKVLRNTKCHFTAEFWIAGGAVHCDILTALTVSYTSMAPR